MKEKGAIMRKIKNALLVVSVVGLLFGMSASAEGEHARKCPVGSCGQYNYSYVTKGSDPCPVCGIGVSDYFRCICGAEYRYCWNGHLR